MKNLDNNILDFMEKNYDDFEFNEVVDTFYTENNGDLSNESFVNNADWKSSRIELNEYTYYDDEDEKIFFVINSYGESTRRKINNVEFDIRREKFLNEEWY